ncbi:uncharacterized protein LOC118784384 [Megalops cyprinoides]|uniref:uncharacterized protein LOC118784384 n=1 Tax=Megalops cyprinoides TaxID=118141 RepID=UPI001864A979|nr:uncharacterized protein LOC118784384 [Megalops cyprinoides]
MKLGWLLGREKERGVRECSLGRRCPVLVYLYRTKAAVRDWEERNNHPRSNNMAHECNLPCQAELRGVISNLEQKLGHHIDNLIEQDNLSSSVVSREIPLSCTNFNSDSILDVLRQNNFQGNDEVPSSPLMGGKSSGITGTGADINSHDTKSDTVFLNSAALEQYSDVSSCSDLDMDRTMSYVELKPDCNQHIEIHRDESTLEGSTFEIPCSSLHHKDVSQNSLEHSDSNGDDESDDPKQNACDLHTLEATSCGHVSFLSSVCGTAEDLREHFEGEDTECREGMVVDQDDQYSNMKAATEVEGGQSPVRVDGGMDGDHSTIQGSDGARAFVSAPDCQDVTGEPHICISTFEMNAVEANSVTPVCDCNCMDHSDMSTKDSVPGDAVTEGSDLDLQSCSKSSQNLHSEMCGQKQLGMDSINKNYILEKREGDSFDPINSEGERSSFEFLKRCLGLRNFSTGSSLGKEGEALTEEETIISPVGEEVDQVLHEYSMPRTFPPTLEPVDLEHSYREQEK